MIPDLGESGSSGLTLWQELQNTAWQDYQSGCEDVFSAEDDPMGRGVGQIVFSTAMDEDRVWLRWIAASEVEILTRD